MRGTSRVAAVLAVLFGGLAFGAAQSSAVTITNCEGKEPLEQAVADGGDYTFDCPAGPHTIYLTNTIQVASTVSLDATGDQIRIINTNNNGPLFRAESGKLTLINLTLQISRTGGVATAGATGTNAVQGEDQPDFPCTAENEGETATEGGDAHPTPDDAGDGGDGADLDGGAFYIDDGGRVDLYGGVVMGSVSAQRGGEGGRGGTGAKGGNGGDVFDWDVFCPHGIHGGKGGDGSDGGDGGDGGVGGDARGGGAFVSAGATLNVNGTTFRGSAAGGGGGPGGDGGDGGWAGYAGRGSNSSLNGEAGDYSGKGGRGGSAGNAGIGRGGAIYSEGTVNLTDTHFEKTAAINAGGGGGGDGGDGGRVQILADNDAGRGGNAGNGGDAGGSFGGAVFSADGASLNVYSAEFVDVYAGVPSTVLTAGGPGGRGGESAGSQEVSDVTGGNGGDGGDGGTAAFATIAGTIGFKGCAAFTRSAVLIGAPGVGGIGGEVASGGIPGVPGQPGFAGTTGLIDPVGFAPYPCDQVTPVAEGPPGSAVCKDGVDNDGDELIDLADPGCQDDSASPDTTAPQANLGGPKNQKLGKSVLVTVRCPDEACTVAATGKLSFGPKTSASKSKAPDLGRVKRKLAKGKTAKFKLAVKPRARKAARKALKQKRSVKARIKVTVSDSAGNRRTLTRSVELKLPR